MNSLLIKKIEDNLARKNNEFQYNGINKKTGTLYDQEGFNMYGFSGSNRKDINVDFEGYTDRGFDKDGINVETKKPWDKNGFDIFGINIYTNSCIDVNNKNVAQKDLSEEEKKKLSKKMFVQSVEELEDLKEMLNLADEKVEYINSSNSEEEDLKEEILKTRKETDQKLISQYAVMLQNKIRYLKPEEMNIQKDIYEITNEIDNINSKTDRNSRIDRIYYKAQKLAKLQNQEAIIVGNLDAYREITSQIVPDLDNKDEEMEESE